MRRQAPGYSALRRSLIEFLLGQLGKRRGYDEESAQDPGPNDDLWAGEGKR